jgi:hypothetical protein
MIDVRRLLITLASSCLLMPKGMEQLSSPTRCSFDTLIESCYHLIGSNSQLGSLLHAKNHSFLAKCMHHRGIDRLWQCRTRPARTPTIITTFSVLADMAHQIAGDTATVTSLVPTNGDAHVFEPTPANGVALVNATAVIELGSWL